MKNSKVAFAIASALTLISSISLADDLYRTTIETSVNKIPRIVDVQNLAPVTFVENDSNSQVYVSLSVAADSQENLDNYTRSWTIKTEQIGNILKLSRESISTIAKYRCSSIRIGSRVLVQGACEEAITISVPRGVRPTISSGGITLSFMNQPTRYTAVVSDQQTENLIAKYKAATFSSDKTQVINSFIEYVLESNRLKMAPQSIVSVLNQLTFDSDKIEMLKKFSNHLADREMTYIEVMKVLTHDSSKLEASKVIFGM